jgi:surface antigen
MRAKNAVAVVLLATLSGAPLLGCETIEKETGIGKDAQTGVLAGAAFGGIVAALADANPAWIAASILLGGAAGGYLGDTLGKKDAETHAQTQLGALESLGKGETKSWSDPETGNGGSTMVTDVATLSNGTVCKSFTETVRTGSKTVTQEGTACKAPGGSWKVQQA